MDQIKEYQRDDPEIQTFKERKVQGKDTKLIKDLEGILCHKNMKLFTNRLIKQISRILDKTKGKG